MDDADIAEQIDRLLPDVCKGLHASIASDPEAARRTYPQIKVMGFLYYHDPATVSEVAAGVGGSLPAVSELIDRLVDDGRVERSANPHDRRQVLLRLTPEARAFGDRLHATRRAQIRVALEQLAPEERPAALKAVQALAVALHRETAAPGAEPPAEVPARSRPGDE